MSDVVEGRMPGDRGKDRSILNVRLPKDLCDRIDSLQPLLAEKPDIRLAGSGVTRSTVVRLALQRGLEALETELGVKRKRGR